MTREAFSGAKLMLFLGDSLLVIRRDNIPDIPFPGHLDFPGGGREGVETPQDCVLRETYEEVGLQITPGQLVWIGKFQSEKGWHSWFFAAHLDLAVSREVRLGDEGCGWGLMSPQDYLCREDAIPHFKLMLRRYFDSRGELIP